MKEVIEMKYSAVIPYVAVAVIVFVAVSSAFICYGIYDTKNNVQTESTTVGDYVQKNLFISVQNSETNTLETNLIISIDPKNFSVKGLVIPSDTRINIASSDQMFRDVINIGGIEMMRQAIEEIVPLPIDYHLIIKSDDFPDYRGDYEGFLCSVFTDVLWQQSNLNEYLTQILSVANTDLTLMRVEEYSEYISRFSQHTNEFYTIPGNRTAIGEKVFYVTDLKMTNELVNTQILN